MPQSLSLMLRHQRDGTEQYRAGHYFITQADLLLATAVDNMNMCLAHSSFINPRGGRGRGRGREKDEGRLLPSFLPSFLPFLPRTDSIRTFATATTATAAVSFFLSLSSFGRGGSSVWPRVRNCLDPRPPAPPVVRPRPSCGLSSLAPSSSFLSHLTHYVCD